MNHFLSSASLLWKHKRIAFFLLFLEVLFFVLLGILLLHYSIFASEKLAANNQYLSEQKWLSETPTRENLEELNIPSTDVSMLEENNHQIIQKTALLFICLILLFSLFRSLSWSLAYCLTDKTTGIRQHLRIFCVFFLSFLLFSILFSLLFFITLFLISGNFSSENTSYLFLIPLLFLLLLLYFLPLVLTLLPSHSVFSCLKNSFFLGAKKAHLLLLHYLLLLLGILAPLGILYFYLENLNLLLIPILFFFFFWIAYMRIVLLFFIQSLRHRV